MMTSQGQLPDNDDDFPPNPFRYDEDDEEATPAPSQQAAQSEYAAPAPSPPTYDGPPHAPPPPPISSTPDIDDPYATSFEPVDPNAMGSGAMDPVPNETPAPASRLEQPQPNGFFGKCTACLSVESYRSYFDVDTSDVAERIVGSVKLCNAPDEFRQKLLGVGMNTGKGPDLYGPLWITMSLVFFVAVTSNMAMYLHAGGASDFEYDIRHLIRALSVLGFFTAGLPTIFFLIFRFFGIQITLIELVCLYGYSLVPYLPTTILCLIPWGWFVWLCLLGATGVSVMLVLRNVAGPVLTSDISQNKAGPILVAVLVCHFVFFLVLKISFYHH